MSWYKYRIIYMNRDQKYYIQRRFILWYSWRWFYRCDEYSVQFINRKDVFQQHRRNWEAMEFPTVEQAKEKLEFILKPRKKEVIVVYPNKPKKEDPIIKRKIKV